MFFSPELLSKRDSGFGLLWLAATLGSKSAFRKLPKRSVMTADISQLCQLIATPAEPLALRLSSNLLVGAARVYRVKQEIFLSDVTTCFNSLKRIEHEFRSMISSEGQLQMAQPSVKSSTVTLRVDPGVVFSVEFDAMVTNWDDYLNLGGTQNVEDDSDDNYNPKKKGKGKVTASSALPPNSELLRATAYTLPDNHDFLLANSFDASFGGSGTTKPPSSQVGGFSFDDTFDGLDIGEGVGDDLLRELGEEWGACPFEETAEKCFTQAQEPFDMDFDTGVLDDDPAGLHESLQLHIPANSNRESHAESVVPIPPSPSLIGAAKPNDFQILAPPPRSPSAEPTIHAAYTGPMPRENNGTALRKAKRARAMLDIRTELTDEELKATRIYYLDKQNTIRCELEFKKFEKMQVDLIDNLLWNAPGSVHAKELVDFWVNHFKTHVEARSGVPTKSQRSDSHARRKRQKISTPPPEPHPRDTGDIPMLSNENWLADQDAFTSMEDGGMRDFLYKNDAMNWNDIDDYTPNTKNLRSSEEPGQPRRASRLSPALENETGADVISDAFHSQHSALFPWNMAGSSSSVSTREGRTRRLPSDQMSVEHADAKLRGSPTSRRGSSLPSVPGNLQGGLESPAVILPLIQSDDDFVFDVPGGDDNAVESRQSETNRVALEKNSCNFLEYVKMQNRSLPSNHYLVFEDVVPKETSTARVAAAALYHCLVLATKDLLQVDQMEAYGRINIRIIS